MSAEITDLPGRDSDVRDEAGPAASQTTRETSEPAPKGPRRRSFLKFAVVGGGILVIVVGLLLYWRYEDLHPTTSDAYVHGHVVHVAPEVAGRVVAVRVADNQHVERGDTLLEIDPRPFRIAVDRAQARLDLARQAKEAAVAAMDKAKATVAQVQARFGDVEANSRRTLKLVADGTLSKERGDDAQAALAEARANLAAVSAAHKMAARQKAKAVAAVRAAQSDVDQSLLDLSYTTIKAPDSGVLGEIHVRPGNMVSIGESLFPLVEDRSFWVHANYKETDLHRIRPGQPATITLDIYPNQEFRGTVGSVSPASGVAFSLLPPENATGNWVKVTQRFPVKILMSEEDPSHPFRIGASAEVTIDVTADHD